MKKNLLFSALVLSVLSHQAKAQTPFTTIDSIDINNINAAVLVHGDLWWNPTTQIAHCNFPPNSVKNVNFAGSIWMSAYDGANQLHVAAQTYRQDGNDYWPGPLDASDTLTYTTSQSWAKIWKVNRTDIQSFQLLTTHTTSNTPQAILTWPAKGNTYAQGHGGAALTIIADMAPFVDLNSNGIYEPLLGEYPDVPGDQALWWVFSDNGPTHTQSHGKPLKVEVHAMAYAYNRGGPINNVIYYDYIIVNRSANAYHNFRIGQWDDIDLGYDLDDFIGFDSARRMGIAYNGNNDDGQAGGHPANSYGTNPPQSAITMIVLPGDISTNYVPLGSFMYFNNDATAFGNPKIDTEFNYYLRGKFRTGEPIDSAYPAAPPNGVAGLNPDYFFPGDPSNTAQWSECSASDLAGDRRFVLASNDFTINAGGSEHVVFALVVAESAGGCGATNFNTIKTVADTARNIYHNPLPPLPLSVVNNTIATHTINLFPNPCHDKLYLESPANNISDATISIYNTIGQIIDVTINKNNQKYELDISLVPAGLYYLHFSDGNTQAIKKFVKE